MSEKYAYYFGFDDYGHGGHHLRGETDRRSLKPTGVPGLPWDFFLSIGCRSPDERQPQRCVRWERSSGRVRNQTGTHSSGGIDQEIRDLTPTQASMLVASIYLNSRPHSIMPALYILT